MCVYIGPILILRPAALTRMHEILPLDGTLQFALVKCLLRPQQLHLCLQHPGAFLFTYRPGTGLPDLQSQPQLSAIVRCPAGHPHLHVCSEVI